MYVCIYRAVVADAFHQCYKQLSGELHKSEVLLIASTLFVVKTENIFRILYSLISYLW